MGGIPRRRFLWKIRKHTGNIWEIVWKIGGAKMIPEWVIRKHGNHLISKADICQHLLSGVGWRGCRLRNSLYTWGSIEGSEMVWRMEMEFWSRAFQMHLFLKTVSQNPRVPGPINFGVCSFKKHFLNIYCRSGSVRGSRNTVINNAHPILRAPNW